MFKEKMTFNISEMSEIEMKRCSRCRKTKNENEFTEPRKLCNKCIDDKKIS